jgi:quercetin dioxygenase-like cupin family protein
MIAQKAPYMLATDEGTALWFLGSVLTRVKATGEQTGGAFGLIDQRMPAGFVSPYHLHHAEDEAYYVLDGQITFICGGERIVAGPGAYVYGPREVPHGLKVDGDTPARMLLMNTPAGFERFVVALSEPVTDPAAPPPAPPAMETLLAVAARFNIDILGPLPE